MAQVHLHTVEPFEFPQEATITVMTAQQLQVTAWPLAFNLYGAFDYGDGFGGTLTGITVENLATGAVYYEVTGLWHDAGEYLWLIATGDIVAADRFLFSGADVFTGHEGDDALFGYGGSDTLSGGAGDDLLDDGAEDGAPDTLAGGPGDDMYFVSAANDTVVEAPGEGYDLVFALSSYAIPPDVEDLAGVGDAPADLTGNAAANVITGNTWANRMRGLDGDDTLNGFGGADTLEGGGGNDLYIVDDPAATLFEAEGGGQDRVQSSVSLALSPGIETLVLTGFADIDGGGNAQANRIEGNAGANRLFGGGGADTLHGGDGDDTYWIDTPLDVVWDASGTDAIATAIEDYALGTGNIENLFLLEGVARGFGDGGANRLTGNAGANTLSGGAGDDTLDGAGGVDSLEGGAGDDTYVVDTVLDVAAEAPASGWDTLVSTVTVTLPAHLEQLVLAGSAAIDGTGNAADNRIVGNAAYNFLDGGAGRDTLEGGPGGDVYFVDDPLDLIVEDPADEALETVSSKVSFDLSAQAPLAEELVLAGSADIDARGNAQPNFLVGNGGRNVLTAVGPASMFGHEGDDTLLGGAGDDRLLGGPGADFMSGGGGNDWYEVEGEGDVFAELPGEGNDMLVVPYSLTMPANFERLMLGGTADLDASGNAAGGELVVGNDGRNVLHTGGGDGDRLEGGGGDDVLHDDGGAAVLTGGFGNDSYFVSDPGTVAWDADQSGEVTASVDYTLWNSLRDLTLVGGGRGTGNALANTLLGDAGANLLEGLQGNDTLRGGGGNDTLVGDAGIDTAVFAGAAGSYSVTRVGGTAVVQGPEGTDVLVGVENLQFAGTTLVLDSGAPEGEVVLTGAFVEGHVVAARVIALGDPDGITGDVEWQWFRQLVVSPPGLGFGIVAPLEAVEGGDSAELMLQEGDAWTALYFVRATFVDGAGNTETVWSGISPNVLEAGAEVLNGSSYADFIAGGGGSEYLAGGSGDDTLAGGGGNDTLDGGWETDTAVLDGLAGVRTYGRDGSSWHVEGNAGTLLMWGMERARLGDWLFALDTDPGGNAWEALALQWAWLGHAPGASQLSAVVAELDSGASRVDAAAGVLGDVLSLPGHTREVVAHLYLSVAGIVATEAQVDAFASQVGPGLAWESNAELLAAVSHFDLSTARFVGVQGTPLALDPAFFGG